MNIISKKHVISVLAALVFISGTPRVIAQPFFSWRLSEIASGSMGFLGGAFLHRLYTSFYNKKKPEELEMKEFKKEKMTGHSNHETQTNEEEIMAGHSDHATQTNEEEIMADHSNSGKLSLSSSEQKAKQKLEERGKLEKNENLLVREDCVAQIIKEFEAMQKKSEKASSSSGSPSKSKKKYDSGISFAHQSWGQILKLLEGSIVEFKLEDENYIEKLEKDPTLKKLIDELEDTKVDQLILINSIAKHIKKRYYRKKNAIRPLSDVVSQFDEEEKNYNKLK